MRNLTDRDIEEMASAVPEPIENIKEIRRRLGIKVPPRRTGLNKTIDCHMMTEEAAFDEINAKIKYIQDCLESKILVDNELIVITGKSGIIKRSFHLSIADGYLKDSVKSWRLENPGCYRIKIKE